jgi:hypothetical protein
MVEDRRKIQSVFRREKFENAKQSCAWRFDKLLRVFENMVLRRIFRPRSDEVRG